MAKWMLRRTSADTAELTRQAGIHPVLGRILAVRGYQSLPEIKAFLEAEKVDYADPLLFADMAQAVRLTQEALAERKKIAIFGDYDADGIMSTVILYRTLKALSGEVTYYIPNREGEGYGLNCEALSRLKAQGVEFIIACDNGISAFAEVDFAAELGLQLIILDHHAVIVEAGEERRPRLPAALAVVDAKREDCAYPFKYFCAAGLCYRFSQALFAALNKDWRQLGESYLPFAVIATVCDLVELTGENRKLVKSGLPLIAKSPNLGLRALITATGLVGKAIDTYHVGFILGPCINASGRLDDAAQAVELFLTEDPAQAAKLAAMLVELNSRRRSMTEEGAKLAFQLIESRQLNNNKIIVLYHPEFLESVTGIIAGKVKEKYYRPVIMLGGDKETVRGSCRSIEAYNIFEGLLSCQEYLIEFGGHPMAAGLSIERSRIEEFARRINDLCQLTPNELQPLIRVDCQLPPAEATFALAQELEIMAPYGKGNHQPLFVCRGLYIERLTQLGINGQTLRLLLKESSGRSCEMISFTARDELKTYVDASFGSACWDKLLAGQSKNTVRLDIIYTLQINSYNGKDNAQLQLIDFRPSA